MSQKISSQNLGDAGQSLPEGAAGQNAANVEKKVNAFLAKKGVRYIALVQLPLPDDDPLYIEFDNGVIQDAGSSAGTISIFDAESELRERMSQVTEVRTGKEEIEGKVRSVLYLYYSDTGVEIA